MYRADENLFSISFILVTSALKAAR